MRLLQVKLLPLVAMLLFVAGCATTPTAVTAPPAQPAVTPSAAGHTEPVPQDPALRITTKEVMALFEEVYGDAPLIEETLKKNDRFVLVDTRPLVRFNRDTVPGSIHIPTPAFEREIPNLPKDKKIIFYCGGLA
jgi:hypothetical protein